MISETEFDELQYRISDRKKKYHRTDNDPSFPLQKVLSCGVCGGSNRITGSKSSNGHGGTFERYYCLDCKKYSKKKSVHNSLDELLDPVRLDKRQQQLLIKALRAVWRQKRGDRKNAVITLSRQRDELLRTKSRYIALYAKQDDLSVDISVEIAKIKSQINDINSEIDSLSADTKEQEAFIEFALKYVSNLSDKWWDLTKEDKLWCQKLLFPGEILVFNGGIIGTNKISHIIRLANTKKDPTKSPFSRMVELPGTAPGSEK